MSPTKKSCREPVSRRCRPSLRSDSFAGSAIFVAWTTVVQRTSSMAILPKQNAQSDALNFDSKMCASADLKALGMPANSWKAMAEKRVVWRSAIHEGVKYHDKVWFNQLAKKREKIKCGRDHLKTPS